MNTIQEKWESLELVMKASSAAEAEIRLRHQKVAFYAGARAMMTLLHEACSLSDEAGAAMMNAWNDELNLASTEISKLGE